MFTRLQGIVDQIAGKKVLVIGDLMLDTYIFGEAQRLSPEAPVPVVPVQKRLFCPGGAANVAENLLGLGAQVTLAGFAGVDAEGNRLVGGMMDSPSSSFVSTTPQPPRSASSPTVSTSFGSTRKSGPTRGTFSFLEGPSRKLRGTSTR